MSEKLVLIDGQSLIHKAFYDVPDIINSQGIHTNAVIGFLNIFLKLVKEENPDHAAIVFSDDNEGSVPELAEQFTFLKSLLESMNIFVMSKAGAKKEEILEGCIRSAEKNGIPIILISADKNVFKRCGRGTVSRLFTTESGKSCFTDYSEEDIKEPAINALASDDPEFDVSLSEFNECFTKEAYELALKLEYKRFIDQFPESISKGDSVRISKPCTVKTDEFLNALKEAVSGDFGLQILCEEGNFYGAALCYEAQGEYLRLYSFRPGDEEFLSSIRKMMAGMKGTMFTCNVKPEYDFIDRSELHHYFDSLIGAYLLNPLKNDYDAEALSSEFLDEKIAGMKERLGKAGIADSQLMNPDGIRDWFSDETFVALAAGRIIRDRLKNSGMLGLFEDIEMPVSLVLYDMEKEGVRVKKEELKSYGEKLAVRISQLEEAIISQAGEAFNINSPKQLGEILFEKMGIPGGKKTKTGYSTSADVLEKLAPDYPFVSDILEYRALTKLKSTYADGLAAYIGEDGRIHTNFNQMITATGRISSTEPNLQNIPIRTELGRELRKVFVPKEGCVFVDADYSQIELRVLASLSGDEELIEAYRNSKDIHRITASKVFGVPFEEVTEQMRRNAKAVNFGIVYGISSFGLSQDLSISRKEAEEYIKQYFNTYPKIKSYLDGLVSSAKETGYSVTYFGRRRPIPELKANAFMQRQFGERVAMNAPIQGTAADIIKIAMIKVHDALTEGGYRSRLILQVHDELVIETYEEEKEAVSALLSDCMMHAANLAVELSVGLGVGSNWYEAH